MKIKDRTRGGMQGRTSAIDSTKVKYNFDISILDLMCSYVLSKNSNIKRGNLINMRNLFDMIDMSVYEKDREKLKRVNFIRKGLEARLIKDLKNPALILSYINGGITEDGDIKNLDEISNTELEYIDSTVTGALNSALIDKQMDNFFELYTEFKAHDYNRRYEMDEKIQNFVSDMHNSFRKNMYEAANTTSFSFDKDLETKCSDIYDILTSESRYLYSCMQGVNMLVGGGFEATRVYLILGLGGIGKSMLMLNLALQMKKANKGYQTKDPTKKPTIVFLTQENTIEETVDRICNIVTGNNMKNLDKEVVIDRLKTDGGLIIEGDNNINIDIIYRPDRSIDTGDLYTIIEDLEDDGYETIALFQDHIKRIKSVDKHVAGDVRLELGYVINELKILAQLKQIPIITVSHMNRDAAAKIDNASETKTDLTRLLGRSNIGESMLMYDNADCVLLANREIDVSINTEYLVLSGVKLRNADCKVNYICQPFEKGSGTKLVEDLDKPIPAYRVTLVPDLQQNQNEADMQKLNVGVPIKRSSYTSFNNIVEDNIFDQLGQTDISSCNNRVKAYEIDDTTEDDEEDIIVYESGTSITSLDPNKNKDVREPDTNNEPLPFILWN